MKIPDVKAIAWKQLTICHTDVHYNQTPYVLEMKIAGAHLQYIVMKDTCTHSESFYQLYSMVFQDLLWKI
jgi:hypothetical protein